MAEERYAIVDGSRAPIVHVRVVSTPTDAGYQRYLDELGEAFRALDRFAMVFDVGELTDFPAKYREVQSKWIADTEEEFKGRFIASAFVIKKRVLRGVLMALFWINEPYYEHTVVGGEEEAWQWVRDALLRAEVPLPPD
jgi:hypothetical protein